VGCARSPPAVLPICIYRAHPETSTLRCLYPVGIRQAHICIALRRLVTELRSRPLVKCECGGRADAAANSAFLIATTTAPECQCDRERALESEVAVPRSRDRHCSGTTATVPDGDATVF
jgi:hypothetical protein